MRAAFGVRRYHGDDATPIDEYHRRDLAFTFPGDGVIDADLLADFAVEIEPLVARIQAEFTIEWDGCNYVGKLNKDALESMVSLADQIERADIGSDWTMWDAGEWLEDSRGEIKATMDDSEIAEWVAEMEAVAKRERVILRGDVAEWAGQVRAEKIETLKEEAADGESPTWWPSIEDLAQRGLYWLPTQEAWLSCRGQPESPIHVKWYPDYDWQHTGMQFAYFACRSGRMVEYFDDADGED